MIESILLFSLEMRISTELHLHHMRYQLTIVTTPWMIQPISKHKAFSKMQLHNITFNEFKRDLTQI